VLIIILIKHPFQKSAFSLWNIVVELWLKEVSHVATEHP
jgi:hypothetical protein